MHELAREGGASRGPLPNPAVVAPGHPRSGSGCSTWPDLFDGYPNVRRGEMEVPGRPGWGMTINDHFLRAHAPLVHWRA